MNNPFGFTPGNGNGDDDNPMAAMGAMFEQLGKMFSSASSGADAGPVNWDSAREASTTELAKLGDPAVRPVQIAAVEQAAQLADLWLNDVMVFPTTGLLPKCVTRTEWITETFPVWQTIVQPVAQGVSSAMTGMMPTDMPEGPVEIPEELLSQLPDEMATAMREMLSGASFADIAGPMMSAVNQMGSTMFGMQFGQQLATMSSLVLSGADVGIQLTGETQPTFVVSNIDEFGEGLAIEHSDVLLYIALREQAHQRLFHNVPWLRSQVLAAIEDYARNVSIDTSAIEQAISQLDPEHPEAFQELLGDGLFEDHKSPEQQAALERLELLLALVEGWVESTVTAAVSARMPAGVALAETFRRRRAAGGPAEKMFAGLIGLELRPRRLREASALWTALTAARGIDARDDIWSHPDLLPTIDDIADATTVDAYVNGERDDLMAQLEAAMQQEAPHDPQDPTNGPQDSSS